MTAACCWSGERVGIKVGIYEYPEKEMTMRIESWLADFLIKRKIIHRDGHGLYTYRVDFDEYRNLQEVLVQNVHQGHISSLVGSQSFCAALVLYAAEWWRREYEGGHWKWDEILNSIDSSLTESMSPNQRTTAILSGLAYWGLQPAEGGKKYFGSIVLQGGLPLYAIKLGEGSSLRKIMMTVLHQASRFHWNEQQIAEVVGEQSDHLAQSLQKQEFYLLVAQMVCAALRLKQEFQLEGEDDPIAILKEKSPDWKNEFPISLDDDAALLLLEGLVKYASRTVAVADKVIFSVERLLHPKGDNIYELRSAITCPERVLGSEFEAFADFHNDWPGHFYIDASVDIRREFAHARLLLGATTPTIKLTPQRQHWSGEVACKEHLLCLRGPAGNLIDKPIAIPGGDALNFDEPWIFAQDDEIYRMVGIGDARLRETEVLLAVNRDWEISAEGEVTSFGTLCFNSREERLLKRVVGTAHIEGKEDSWDIKTGVTTNSSVQLILEGRRVPLQTRPWPLFRGMPKVVFYDDDGVRHQVLKKDLRLLRSGSKELVPYNPMLGLVHLVVEKDGERLGRLRFGVISENSKESYVSGADPSNGSITFSGWGQFSIGSHDEKVTVEKHGESQLHLTAFDKPPGFVPVSFKWPGSPIELKAHLPFPATGGRGYDEHDKPITSGSIVALSRLLGKRILVFDSNPDRPKQYELELVLSTTDRIMRSIPTHTSTILLKNGSTEIRLTDYYQKMESLLVFSDDLDAKVTVTLKAGGQPNFYLNVSRYDTLLSRDGDIVKLLDEFIDTLTPEQLMQVQALAVSLSAPEKEKTQPLVQHAAEGVPTGQWNVGHLPTPDTWLVVPTENSPIFFRPTVVVTEQTDEPTPTEQTLCQLAQAMQHVDAEERAKDIDDALETIVSDFNDPSWEFLNQLWQTFKHLPLCSLDVFRRLASQPDIAVAMLFAPSPDFGELVRRLRDELGLMLEIAPMSSWRLAVGNLCKYYEKLVGDAAKDVLPSILKNRFDDLETMLSNHPLLLDILCEETGCESNGHFDEVCDARHRNPEHFSKGLWKGGDAILQRYLLRVHGDDKWPVHWQFVKQTFSELLKKVDSRSKNIIIDKKQHFFWTESRDFKLSVVNIPALCAIWVACNLDSKWWRKPSHMYSLRILRTFDPAWFDECYRMSLASCFTFGLLSQGRI
jgi:hypothetical protein